MLEVLAVWGLLAWVLMCCSYLCGSIGDGRHLRRRNKYQDSTVEVQGGPANFCDALALALSLPCVNNHGLCEDVLRRPTSFRVQLAFLPFTMCCVVLFHATTLTVQAREPKLFEFINEGGSSQKAIWVSREAKGLFSASSNVNQISKEKIR